MWTTLAFWKWITASPPVWPAPVVAGLHRLAAEVGAPLVGEGGVGERLLALVLAGGRGLAVPLEAVGVRDDALGAGPEHLVAAGVIGVVVGVDQELDAARGALPEPGQEHRRGVGVLAVHGQAPASLTR